MLDLDLATLIEPNIHPVAVHFAYALTVTSALAMFVVSVIPSERWRHTLQIAADWMMALGAVAIVLAIMAGLQAFATVTHDAEAHEVMKVHRLWAIGAGIAVILLTAWRWSARRERPSVIFAVIFLAAASALSVAAWHGSQLVFTHGIGVKSLPDTDGDHEHAEGEDHDHAEEETTSAANTDNESAPATPVLAEGEYPETPEGVIDAFSAALTAKDQAAVEALLAPDVVVYESGHVESGFEEYAQAHMTADMEFMGGVEFTTEKRDVYPGETHTTVITQSVVHGTFGERKIDSRSLETMVLRKDGARWRITHIHWSSAPLPEDHEH